MLIHSDERDEAKAVRQKFLAHETTAKPNKPDAEQAPPLPHGAGGGSEHAIAKALSGWSDSDSKPSSSDVAAEKQSKAKVAGSSLQAGANLEMTALNVPVSDLNPQAQSLVDQGAQPVQLFGNGASLGRIAALGGTENQQANIEGGTGNPSDDMGALAERYGVQTVVNPDGTIVITSNGIQIQVQNLGSEFDELFAGKTDAEIEQMLQASRDRKNADDTLAYGQGTDELRAQAMAGDDPYYYSEQHVVWAISASARTGGRIPPEYFMELDPFGGTAGNGPEIISPGDWAGGGAGGMLSTISIGHDTDWDIGRYFGIGPLDELHALNPNSQLDMQLMGTVGLMPSEVAMATVLSSLPPQTQAEIAAGTAGGGILGGVSGAAGGYMLTVDMLRDNPDYAPYLSAIDANAGGEGFYSTGNSAWDVNYSWDYIAQNTNGEDWNATLARPIMDQYRFTPEQRDPNAPRRNDLDDLIQQHSPGHRPDDEHESA